MHPHDQDAAQPGQPGPAGLSEHPSWAARFVPDGEPFPDKACRAEGWAYEDFMWQVFSRDEFSALLEALGPENFRMIALSLRDGGDKVRGQMAVAPLAIPILEAWKASRPGRNILTGAQGRKTG